MYYDICVKYFVYAAVAKGLGLRFIIVVIMIVFLIVLLMVTFGRWVSVWCMLYGFGLVYGYG